MNIQAKSSQNNNHKIIQAKTQQNRKYNYPTDEISFRGIHCSEAKALFVFDLDGSFAYGTNKDIKKVLELQKKVNAVLTYATGRTFKEFLKFQEKLLNKEGIILPTPEYLITNNGQFVHENIDGKLVEDLKWQSHLREKTGFDRDKVYNAILKIAHRKEYKHTESEIQKIRKFGDFEERKKEDPEFWDSKISHYEWSPSKHMIEYFVASDVDIEKLQKTISEELLRKGIKTKFILNRYPKNIMDACPEKLIRQSRPLREDCEGNMTAMFLCPADKADGIEYVRKKLNIQSKEVVMAGNESNDISMTELTQKGSFFICVGNAADALRNFIHELKKTAGNKFPHNCLITTKEGTGGIVEGINKIMSQNIQ